MTTSRQFAVLQKESTGPTADQLKRAFKSFSNLTEADAVRLASQNRGILLRQLPRGAALALQKAFQAEGVSVVVVSEDDLPRLPEGKAIHRLEISPEALVVYDLLGRPKPVPWADLALVAAGQVRHFEMGQTRKESVVMRLNPITGLRPKTVTEIAHKVEADSQRVLEILLSDALTRYQIDAARFPFKYLIDRPELSIADRFAWLVREICQRATRAIFNSGACRLRDGLEAAPEYSTRQAMADEMIWLLWHHAPANRTD